MRLFPCLVRGAVVLGAVVFSPSVARAQLLFNFIDPSNIKTNNPVAYNAIVQAGARWSALFSDSMTVNIEITMPPLADDTNGSARTFKDPYSYADVRKALFRDIKSQDDISSTLDLPQGSSVNMLLNFTNNNPKGAGSGNAYLDDDGDDNNSTILMTNANAKALKLRDGTDSALDAEIRFNSKKTFDFDPSNGIAKDQLDFVGIATHEIGHALGFISGVDKLDRMIQTGVGPDDSLPYVSTLDLFRFSKASVLNGVGVIDWTVDNRIKYFSVDGGITAISEFSTGRINGDGSQASHWSDDQTLGIMAPGGGPGDLLRISRNDLRAFDVIGYDLVTPEPGTWALIGACTLASAAFLKRRRKRPAAVAASGVSP